MPAMIAMSLPPCSPLLEETLRVVARRYRLPASASSALSDGGLASALALTIEQARLARERGQSPDPALRQVFVDALAHMIRAAMRADRGDPAFQAMVLRHRADPVREYASLSAHAAGDRRSVRAAVNGIAHPGKQGRMPPGRLRESLARLHGCAASADWPALQALTREMLAMPEIAREPVLARSVASLQDNPALARLLRLDVLASDALVRHYQSLWERHGPRSGSPAAAAQGGASRQRGAAVEAAAAHALQALARRLNEAQGAAQAYRVATSMRVPASIPADAARAKSEWDAALLRRTSMGERAAEAWDLCLLVEAKASVDAATTDLPRLLRGLRLLAHAEEGAVYPFLTAQGTIGLNGASLRALRTDEAALAGTVLYCCDAPAEAPPRLLSAASRMQLLSAPASLAFASALAQGRHADPMCLAPVWHDLLEAPGWRAVLEQYPALRQVRALMVHVDDLLAAAGG